MKYARLLAPSVFLSLITASFPAFPAPVGLNFAGGCPESEQTDTCMPGGNATETNVADVLGIDTSLVTQVTSGFSYTGTGTSGTWAVTDASITHLAFKAAGFFILAERTALTGEWSTNPADWDLTAASCPIAICNDNGPRSYVDADFINNGGQIPDIGHVSAFTVVPVPAAIWLFGSGALGLIRFAKRRRV